MSHEIQEKPYTYQYFQPSEYRFSMDSVHLPWRVSKLLDPTKSYQVLDLCAGCGVMGFELSFYCDWIEQIDFIEVQNAYREYFDKNKAMVLNDERRRNQKKQYHFLNINYNQVKSDPNLKQKYNLIICNPPYFFKNQGSPPPDELKSRSRFFLDASFEELIESMKYSLTPNGEIYMLFRSQDQHAIEDSEFEKFIKKHFSHIQFLDDIRKTKLLKIYN